VNVLSCLGSDRPMFWRERSHGLVAASFSFAHIVVNSLEVGTQAILYVTVYYLVSAPPLPFVYFMEPILCVAFVCSGWGYLISCLIPPKSATLTAVVSMILLNGALGDPGKMEDYLDGGFMELVVFFCPTRWSVQMFFIGWFEAFGVDIGKKAMEALQAGETGPALEELVVQVKLTNFYRSGWFDQGQDVRKLKYPPDGMEAFEKTNLSDIGYAYWSSAIVVMVLQGFVLRFLTVPILALRNRDKQV